MNKIQIGSTILAKITSQYEMDVFVDSLKITSDIVLIKPNWVDYRPGTHTEAKILDFFLTSLNRQAILLESHTYWRTDKMAKGEGDYFSSKEATLKTGQKHREFFKEQDNLFLKTTGISEVLKKHKAEYLCITEEVWSGNVTDISKVKQLVEKKFEPVFIQDLYSQVPKRLFDLKGSDFVSFSKAKADSIYGASLSIKNLFGLIPDPNRFEKYHGDDTERLLSQSIVDINKIYQSIFKTTFIIEGVFENCYMDWDSGKSTPFYNFGTILGGKDGLEVDTIGCKLLNTSFKEALSNLTTLYKKTFAGNDSIDVKFIPKDCFQ